MLGVDSDALYLAACDCKNIKLLKSMINDLAEEFQIAHGDCFFLKKIKAIFGYS